MLKTYLLNSFKILINLGSAFLLCLLFYSFFHITSFLFKEDDICIDLDTTGSCTNRYYLIVVLSIFIPLSLWYGYKLIKEIFLIHNLKHHIWLGIKIFFLLLLYMLTFAFLEYYPLILSAD